MYTNILVPIDISYETDAWQRPALVNASQMAQLSGGRIHALTVVPLNLFTGYYPNMYTSEISQGAKKKLETMVRTVISGDITVTVGVEHGSICTEILRVAREMPADLIVMASHGPLTRDYLLGSNAAHITLHAACSVFIAREPASAGKQKKFMAEAVSD